MPLYQRYTMQGVPAAKSDYRLQGKLAGHTGAILALKARDDGKFLASGGELRNSAAWFEVLNIP